MKYGKFKLQSVISRAAHTFGEAPTGSEVLTGLLSTVYKVDSTKIAEILKDGATPESILQSIVELDKNRIADLSKKSGEGKFQEGYKKAKSEVLTASETALKEFYGITSDKTGQELIDEIVRAKAAEAGATTEDAIKKTPTYQSLESKLKKELADIKAAKENEIAEIKKTYQKEQTFSQVGTKAIDMLMSLKPILPTTPAVAETYKQDFLNELKQFEYEIQDGKTLVMKDGKLLQDPHGHTLSYEDHIKNIASRRFEFAANNGGANTGATNPPPGTGTGSATYPAVIKTKPTNVAELTTALKTAGITPADKRVIMDTYNAEYAKK